MFVFNFQLHRIHTKGKRDSKWKEVGKKLETLEKVFTDRMTFIYQ